MYNSQPQVPAFPERDQQGSGDLPTYDDLASQHGPNSRWVVLPTVRFHGSKPSPTFVGSDDGGNG